MQLRRHRRGVAQTGRPARPRLPEQEAMTPPAPAAATSTAATFVYEDGVSRQVGIDPDKTLLDCALAAGLEVGYQCRGGTCGTCIVRIGAGSIEQRFTGASALTTAERNAGMALMCRAYADADVRIELPYTSTWTSGGGRPGLKSATVTAVVAEADDVVRLEVELDDWVDDGEDFAFTPGQFARVRVPGTDDQWRSYSMFTVPDDLPRVGFVVRLLPGGAMSDYLVSRCEIGDRVDLEGPFGSFTARGHEGERHILIAGGTGLAPLLSIIDGFRLGTAKPPPIHLVFGVSDAAQLFFAEELELRRLWMKDISITLCADRPASGFQGRTGSPLVALPDLHVTPDDRCYVSGPPAMVGAVAEALLDHGATATRVYTEQFLADKESTHE
ncbi:2Fe-2S iron-sulfur cluster binding domain-containing protein [Streptosporangium sp. NPDC051022]|uniref:2Fe-2S iron-sulfur cluster binding domain-containing protein n=1 Tax=Streptosporangium sp. NPDC051022 TaxID=3155752 RepID=UPI00343A92AF